MKHQFSDSLTTSIWALVFLWIQSGCYAGTVSSDCTVSAVSLNRAPSVGSYDLAQTHYLRSSGTGVYESEADHGQLFNGLIGNDDADWDDGGEVRMGSRSTVTVDFDLSKNKRGYDIRGVDLYFGEKGSVKFRANQEYSIEVTFMNNTTEKIRAKHVGDKLSPLYWSVISFRDKDNGVIASGVKSVTFTLSEKIDAKGLAIGREIDVFGSPSGLEYAMVLESPNGYRVPKILGASGDLAQLTGYDYFSWYGITEHRTWFKPSFSSLANDSGVTSAREFAAATEAIRKSPEQQATSNDYFLDWAHFHHQLNRNKMPETMSYLSARGIMPLITNTTFISDKPIGDDWVSRFKYWKYWYAIVYHFASKHDVTMYAFKNEPHAKVDYDTWESHWLVCADAMRKATEDVNGKFGKSLKVKTCGANSPGVYWNYDFSHPDEDIH